MHWTSLKTRDSQLRSSWQADEIVVARGDELVDQLRSNVIHRVTLIHADDGDSPGEVRAALFELSDRAVLLGAACGIAGRILFERQAYWSQRNCIYWVSERCVAWPGIHGESRWLFARAMPQHHSLTLEAARLLFEPSEASGPHTWDQRKQVRIDRRRPFRGRAVQAIQARSRA